MLTLTFVIPLSHDERNLIDELYKTHYKVLLNYAYGILKSQKQAEDAVHNVFIKISKNLDRYISADSLETKRYLIVSVRNMCYDMLHKPIEAELDENVCSFNIEPDPVWTQTYYSTIIEDMYKIINNMRDIDKSIFIYRFSKGNSCKEIANMLNKDENYITTRISRLRKMIKKELASKWGNISEVI